MRSRYRILERDHAHFITATTVAWLPIFTTAARCDILVDSFEYCRQHKELKLYAWVILDTHFHAIVAAPELARVLAVGLQVEGVLVAGTAIHPQQDA